MNANRARTLSNKDNNTDYSSLLDITLDNIEKAARAGFNSVFAEQTRDTLSFSLTNECKMMLQELKSRGFGVDLSILSTSVGFKFRIIIQW